MKIKFNRVLALAGITTMLCLSNNQTFAQGQGRGNFDPEQMRQRQLERYREAFAVEKDDEWKLIEGRINKVLEARREVGFGGGGMAFAFGRGGGPGGRGGDNADRPQGQRRGGGPGGGRFGGEPSAEAEALQKAIEAKASPDEIKAKLAKYRESRKEKEAALAKAQKDLKDVLTVRQEAAAVLMGLVE